jgi:hypothetical protein
MTMKYVYMLWEYENDERHLIRIFSNKTTAEGWARKLKEMYGTNTYWIQEHEVNHEQ